MGLQLTRQYYLRVIAARDGSPAARAGLRTGDFVRAIDGKSTRDISVLLGTRLLQGAPGTKVSPHRAARQRRRAAHARARPRSASRADGDWQDRPARAGLVRIPAFASATPAQLREQFAELRKQGAEQMLIDLRGTAEGALDDGIAAARLFVSKGVLATRESRTAKTPIEAGAEDGGLPAPVVLLVDNGTSGAAELFAAALVGNVRTSLVGERTLGRAAVQELVKLPDGSALWLSTTRYLTPRNDVIHDKGLKPDVAVDGPDVEFGAGPPQTDPILDKALETIGRRRPRERRPIRRTSPRDRARHACGTQARHARALPGRRETIARAHASRELLDTSGTVPYNASGSSTSNDARRVARANSRRFA